MLGAARAIGLWFGWVVNCCLEISILFIRAYLRISVGGRCHGIFDPIMST
jgi:hypothetical protein